MNVHPLVRRTALLASGNRCEHYYTDGRRCPITKRLAVHHAVYSIPGLELDEHLKVLCEHHHGLKHGIHFFAEPT